MKSNQNLNKITDIVALICWSIVGIIGIAECIIGKPISWFQYWLCYAAVISYSIIKLLDDCFGGNNDKEN